MVPHDRLLMKIAETRLDLMVVVWVNEQLSEEVRVASVVPPGNVLGPLLFLAYVNDIWRNTESNIWLFTDDYIIYRKIRDSSDIDNLQTDLNRLGERAVGNKMKINPGKIKH